MNKSNLIGVFFRKDRMTPTPFPFLHRPSPRFRGLAKGGVVRYFQTVHLKNNPKIKKLNISFKTPLPPLFLRTLPSAQIDRFEKYLFDSVFGGEISARGYSSRDVRLHHVRIMYTIQWGCPGGGGILRDGFVVSTMYASILLPRSRVKIL